jgi:hypothetical protein
MTVLAGLTGITGAVTQWVPFTFINLEIIRLEKHGWRNRRNPQSAGTLLGVKNASIAAPQILATLCCTLIFWLVGEDPGSGPMLGMKWIPAGCNIASFVAAALTLRLKEPEVS